VILHPQPQALVDVLSSTHNFANNAIFASLLELMAIPQYAPDFVVAAAYAIGGLSDAMVDIFFFFLQFICVFIYFIGTELECKESLGSSRSVQDGGSG